MVLANKMFLSSDEETIYHTQLWVIPADDYCECKSFKFRHKCKHLTQLKKEFNNNN